MQIPAVKITTSLKLDNQFSSLKCFATEQSDKEMSVKLIQSWEST